MRAALSLPCNVATAQRCHRTANFFWRERSSGVSAARPNARGLTGARTDWRGIGARRVGRRGGQRACAPDGGDGFVVERAVAARLREVGEGDRSDPVEREAHRRDAARATLRARIPDNARRPRSWRAARCDRRRARRRRAPAAGSRPRGGSGGRGPRGRPERCPRRRRRPAGASLRPGARPGGGEVGLRRRDCGARRGSSRPRGLEPRRCGRSFGGCVPSRSPEQSGRCQASPSGKRACRAFARGSGWQRSRRPSQLASHPSGRARRRSPASAVPSPGHPPTRVFPRSLVAAARPRMLWPAKARRRSPRRRRAGAGSRAPTRRRSPASRRRRRSTSPVRLRSRRLAGRLRHGEAQRHRRDDRGVDGERSERGESRSAARGGGRRGVVEPRRRPQARVDDRSAARANPSPPSIAAVRAKPSPCFLFV